MLFLVFWFRYYLRAAATAGFIGCIRIFLNIGFRNNFRATAARILCAENPFQESFLLCHDEI